MTVFQHSQDHEGDTAHGEDALNQCSALEMQGEDDGKTWNAEVSMKWTATPYEPEVE